MYKKIGQNNLKSLEVHVLSFFVPKEEIVENDYDLSINKYKEIVIEKKEYEHPKVILKRVMDMEEEIQSILKELGELL